MASSSAASRVKALVKAVCPHGFLMWREERYFERFGEPEVHFVPHLCRPAAAAVDVGANEGAYLHAMVRHASHVFAYEPVPWLARRLSLKFAGRVTVKEIALSDRAGTAELKIPVIRGTAMTGLSSLNQPAYGDEFHELQVNTAPLDSVFPGSEQLGFIKIDVEGHEDAVLRGARETIVRCRPRVQVEIVEELSPGGLRQIAHFFRELGYSGLFAYGRSIMDVSRFEYPAMQDVRLIKNFGPDVAHDLAGKFVANFIFIPAEESAMLGERLTGALTAMRAGEPQLA